MQKLSMSMVSRIRVFFLAAAVAVAWPAHAQTAPSAGTARGATQSKPPVVTDPTNIDAGKTGEQLFKSNCALCHKTAAGLARAGGILGVQSFLRSHYTASRESASVIANYLAAVDAAAPPARVRRPGTPDAKRTSSKPGAKPAGGNATEAKPADPKVEGTPRPAAAIPESKPAESAPAAPAEQKPAEAPKPE
jgi:mono/diheme cytochrome c family protein